MQMNGPVNAHDLTESVKFYQIYVSFIAVLNEFLGSTIKTG